MTWLDSVFKYNDLGHTIIRKRHVVQLSEAQSWAQSQHDAMFCFHHYLKESLEVAMVG